MRTTICACAMLDADIAKLQEKIEVVAELVKNCVQSNASAVQSQEEYSKQYDSLAKRYEKAVAKREALTTERNGRTERDKELHLFIEALLTQPLVLDTWDERLWITLVEKGTAHTDGRIAFTFKNGTVIEVRS